MLLDAVQKNRDYGMKIRVLHAYYGCESGCCGHMLEVDDETVGGSWTFFHAPDEAGPEREQWIRDYVLKHLPKECHDSIDWSTIEVDSSCW